MRTLGEVYKDAVEIHSNVTGINLPEESSERTNLALYALTEACLEYFIATGIDEADSNGGKYG
ncbi:unnamed protein product [marine sediment metagenome]|uniref:Uncharacterized protein n=1 Tax=marine sediment metagenome TaxID=412755 RepID=X0VJ43_9ZZZZ